MVKVKEKKNENRKEEKWLEKEENVFVWYDSEWDYVTREIEELLVFMSSVYFLQSAGLCIFDFPLSGFNSSTVDHKNSHTWEMFNVSTVKMNCCESSELFKQFKNVVDDFCWGETVTVF